MMDKHKVKMFDVETDLKKQQNIIKELKEEIESLKKSQENEK